MADEQTNLPAQIAGALAGIPKALMPTCIKALDRLVSAAIDVPVAWLNQKKATIDAQTSAYTLVETAIGEATASIAAADAATIERASKVLIRKAYQRQVNREAVAAAMLEDLTSDPQPASTDTPQPSPGFDEDWLNVFERYAEDASTERMQNLWGRVLAGEIRKPGRYSMRTLRFLSEFSQADGLTFATFANSAFADIAPNKLVKPEDQKDIRTLIYLESAGLIQGASGLGLSHTITLDGNGTGVLREGNLLILFKGEANGTVKNPVCALTPLGQELLSLIPGRDSREAARQVGHAFRAPSIKSAYLCAISANDQVLPMEVLWQEEAETIQATAQ